MEIKICLDISQRERHTGKCLTVIIEGMPSGVEISLDEINEQLAKQSQGYGRGGRMRLKKILPKFFRV